MQQRYINLQDPGSFAGLNSVKRHQQIKSDWRNVKNNLLELPAYSLHHPRWRNFKRRQIHVPYINAQWGADLADIQKLSRYNNKKRYILCVIDMFSKRAWMEAIANKTSKNVLQAFKRIIKRSNQKPEKLQTDAGTEFLNKQFQKYLTENNISHFTVTSEIKCSMVERFIRTIMSKIRRYMTHKNTQKFVHLLPKFETLYNSTFHSSIKMAPQQVERSNEQQVYRNLYGYESAPSEKKSKFKIGDHVRISKIKKTFEKGYDTNFTKEVFIIYKIKKSDPFMYYLKDLSNEEIDGGFYAKELLHVKHQV